MKLYEITGEVLALVRKYNDPDTTDEELLALEKQLTGLSLTFDDKAIAVAHYEIMLDGEASTYENEIDRLQNNLGVIRRAKDRLHDYLKRSMEAANILEVVSPTLTLKIVNNPKSVLIEDEDAIPDKYKRTIPEQKVPDKKAIKEEIESGIGVSGAKLQQTTRLKFK